MKKSKLSEKKSKLPEKKSKLSKDQQIDLIEKLLDKKEWARAFFACLPLTEEDDDTAISNCISIIFSRSNTLTLSPKKMGEILIKLLEKKRENKQDEANAHFELSSCYDEGTFGVPKNLELAYKHLKIAAGLGLLKAKLKLIDNFTNAQTKALSDKEYFDLVYSLASVGKNELYHRVAFCYEKGVGTPIDLKNAELWFKKCVASCEGEDFVLAQYNLGCFYYRRKNIKQYIHLLMEAAEAKDCFPAVLFELVEVYFNYETALFFHDRYEKVFQYLRRLETHPHTPLEMKAIVLCKIGLFYDHGIVVKKDKKTALQYFQQSADLNCPEAQHNLAKLLKLGTKRIKQDREKAVTYFKSAVKKDYLPAKFDLALMYYKGEAVKQNYPKAYRLFSEFCERTRTKEQRNEYTISEHCALSALHYLGHCYFHGRGVQQDYQKAFSLYHDIVTKKPDHLALFDLGNCYLRGLGCEINQRKAFALFQSAQEAGITLALFFLAKCFHYGWGTAVNVSEALNLYESFYELSRNFNHDTAIEYAFEAALAVAELHIKGFGSRQNSEKACLDLCLFSPDKTLKSPIPPTVEMLNAVAIFYLRGHGIKDQGDLGIQYLNQAIAQGYPIAMNNLAWCYLQGIQVPQDIHKAIELFTLAKNAGCLVATNNLAWCYLNGIGVEQDLIRAKELFTLVTLKNPQWLSSQYKTGLGFQLSEHWFDYAEIEHSPNMEEQYHLGLCYLQGWGVIESSKCAFEIFERIGSRHLMAGLQLAALYFKQADANKKPTSKEEAESQHPGVKILHDLYTQYPDHPQVNIFRARYLKEIYLEEAIKILYEVIEEFPGQYPEAYYLLAGYIAQISEFEINRDNPWCLPEKMQAYYQAAMLGSGEACYQLGRIFESGLEVTIDYCQAFEYYSMGAELGYSEAQYYLGFLWETGLYDAPGVGESLSNAIECYENAAKLGNPCAMYHLASYYAHGIGLPVNLDQAEFYFKRAAERGFVPEDHTVLSLHEKQCVLYSEANLKESKKRDEVLQQSEASLPKSAASDTKESKETCEVLQQSEASLPKSLDGDGKTADTEFLPVFKQLSLLPSDPVKSRKKEEGNSRQALSH